MRQCFGLLLVLLMMATCFLFSGCKKKEPDNENSSSASISAEGEDVESTDEKLSGTEQQTKEANIHVPLVSTAFSWQLPSAMTIEQTDNGFVAVMPEATLGVACRRINLLALNQGYKSGTRIKDEILASRLYELCFDGGFDISNVESYQVKVAKTPGMLLNADYTVTNYEGRMSAFVIQYGDDVIMFTVVGAPEEEEEINSIMESITVSKNVYTDWIN